MEGLLIAQALERLSAELPARRGGWRFPDEHTFVLPIGDRSLWLFNRPPNPRLELRSGAPPSGGPVSSFQEQLVARAAGELEEVSQPQLDRVAEFSFAGAAGFVETPPVRLTFELTGRNCNLILLDARGIVLGAAREIGSDVNRYRQVIAGRPYLPPPPYEKADPRALGREELRELLAGESLRSTPRLLDGIGPQLVRALGRHAGVERDEGLAGEILERVLDGVELAVADAEGFVRQTLDLPDVADLRRREMRSALLERLEGHLRKELELVDKRLADLERTRAAAADADRLRDQGNLLLAYSHAIETGRSSVELTDFSGQPVSLQLDPLKNAAANAQDYFERARKREARARQAETREPELTGRREELSRLLAGLPELDLKELEEVAAEQLPARQKSFRRQPGAAYRGPHGFRVLVGRNARENDHLTFKVARSRDVWLHVQGYQGSHVIIQAENREVPFDTILFAARLAAGHSRAADSENVPVDYTLRKNVWRPRGAPAGAVHFTRQKTVYVTPSRNPELERS